MKPKLRSIQPQPASKQGQEGVSLKDPFGLSSIVAFIPEPLVPLLGVMDGTRDLAALKTAFLLRGGAYLSDQVLNDLILELDCALMLQNDNYQVAFNQAQQAFRDLESRPPVMAGKAYPGDKKELELLLNRYLDEAENKKKVPFENVNGMICPHIDYGRGGTVYGELWAGVRNALLDIDLVIVLGTDHLDSLPSVTLSRQNYQTPLGTLENPVEIVEEILDEVGPQLVEKELNHKIEHSIETAAVWLAHLMGNKGCRMLPVLCGSFRGLIDSGESPLKTPHIARSIDVLRKVTKTYKTLVIAAADLAHSGPSFGGSYPLDMSGRAFMASRDEELINMACDVNAEGFYDAIKSEGDRRNICGLPPIYMALNILTGSKGEKISYLQCPASPDRTSMVSICGIVYHT